MASTVPCYLTGPVHDFFVKPVILSDSVDGKPTRWALNEDDVPDVWCLYCMDRFHASLRAHLHRPLSDHLTEQEAVKAAEHHHQQDQLAHLLGASYDPSSGRIHMPE